MRRTRLSFAAVLTVAVALAIVRSARADDPRPSASILSTPAALRLGVDRGAVLLVRGPDAPVERVRFVASVGRVERVRRLGPGEYSAEYRPPTSRAPDVAVVLVRFDDTSAAAVASVPLAGRYRLDIHVEPHAEVTARVADLDPVRATATASGRAALTLFVPPGVDRAQVSAVDRGGNRTEQTETLDLPPLHRVLLLDAGDVHGLPRWLVAATAADGALGHTAPTGIELTGAIPEIVPIVPGLFEVTAHVDRLSRIQAVQIRVSAPDLRLSPDRLVALVPAAHVAALRVSPVGALHVGDRPTAVAQVLDDRGDPVLGLADRLVARLGMHRLEVSAHEDSYRLAGPTLEHTGTDTLVVRIDVGEEGPEDAVQSVSVLPGPPVRMLGRPAPLRVGAETVFEARIFDAYGNATVLGHPVVTASGANVSMSEGPAGALRIALVPSATQLRVRVSGDQRFSETLDLVAESPPSRRVSVSIVASVRNNLGAATFFGGRMSVDVHVFERPPWHALALLGLGIDGAQLRDPNGSGSAAVVLFPASARAAVLRTLGPTMLGLAAGGALRLGIVGGTASDGSNSYYPRLIPGVMAGIHGRWQGMLGVLSAEVGVESGSVDSPDPVRGSVGGAYASIGWGAAL